MLAARNAAATCRNNMTGCRNGSRHARQARRSSTDARRSGSRPDLRMSMPARENFSIAALRDADIAPVCVLAREIWMQHYPGIITVRQIEYMLAQRYSPDAIRGQLQAGEAWWAKLEVLGELCGFAGYKPEGKQARL